MESFYYSTAIAKKDEKNVLAIYEKYKEKLEHVNEKYLEEKKLSKSEYIENLIKKDIKEKENAPIYNIS